MPKKKNRQPTNQPANILQNQTYKDLVYSSIEINTIREPLI